ncbi:MAG: tRNA lysidine(34) synthetase TilS [Rhodothermales bacterium]
MNSTSGSDGKRATQHVHDAVRETVPASFTWDARPLVVVGLSGGLDSVVLAHVLDALGARIHAVHINYGLRAAAERDQQWIEALCHAKGWTLTVERCAPDRPGESMQAVARAQRYSAYLEAAHRQQASWVAVGHHANDQAETVLLHLMRKSGPEGLAGMPSVRPMTPDGAVKLIRPLLHVERQHIQDYAESCGLTWCEDESNQHAKYRRNRLRHEILPLLEEVQQGSVSNIARTAQLMRAYVDDTIQPRLERLWQEVQMQDGGLLVPDALLDGLPPVWQGRVLLEALRRGLDGLEGRAAQVEAVLELRQRQVGRRVTSAGGTVWRCRTGVFIQRASLIPEPISPIMVANAGSAQIGRHRLTWARCTHDHPTNLLKPGTLVLDVERTGGTLYVRAWTSGDTLEPLGMKGTKRVSDLLTDAKVPTYQRAFVPVVCDEQGVVLAVLGVRTSRRANVTATTTHIWQLSYTPI